MTLIISVTSKDSIWLSADTRLSYPGSRYKDNAKKLMFLETKDGVAILGYAGLGATGRGSEPADWMSNVLRGRNLPLETCLGIISQGIQNHFPRHLTHFSREKRAEHHVIVPAFVGEDPRLYSIDMILSADRKSINFRYTRHITNRSQVGRLGAPRIGLGGSGAAFLLKDESWMRKLLRLVEASNRGKILDKTVAQFMASLNYKSHLGTKDSSVGPNCIVAWRFRKKGRRKGGGAHKFFVGSKERSDLGFVPTIACGMDVRALVEAILPSTQKSLEIMMKGGKSDDNTEEINKLLAQLPSEPDDTFL